MENQWWNQGKSGKINILRVLFTTQTFQSWEIVSQILSIWVGDDTFYSIIFHSHFIFWEGILHFQPGLCSTHESWVKFDSTDSNESSQSRVGRENQGMSRVRVESRWSSFESELNQLNTAWVKVESLNFRGENVKILQLSVTLQRKNQPTATFDRNPPPVNNFFPN